MSNLSKQKSESVDTKTFFDAGSLIQALREIVDEQPEGDDFEIYAGTALLTSLELRETEDGKKFVVLS